MSRELQVGRRLWLHSVKGVWGVDGDAVRFTTPSVGVASVEVLGVRLGQAVVRCSSGDSFEVHVEASEVIEAGPTMDVLLSNEAELPSGPIPSSPLQDEVPAIFDEENRVIPSEPSASDDARTLQDSKPTPDDDEAVSQAAKRLRKRKSTTKRAATKAKK